MAKYKFLNDPIYPNLDDWPISKMGKNRTQYVKELEEMVFQRIKQRKGDQIGKLLAQTIYKERTRVKEEPWKVDPSDDKVYWRKLQKRLAEEIDLDDQKAIEENDRILKDIIHRYAEEIIGSFRNKTFRFARKFLTVVFNRLLNTAANRNIQRIYGTNYKLHDRMRAYGEIEKLRALFPKGNIVIVPTHFSNLDSILIGYVLDSIIGLPAFAYGAGLNLYNSGLAARYMNYLGAYRVDRRKKNVVYLETLKALSSLLNQKGVNNIFFPGGTRTRSGAIEEQLKLGLLSSMIDAQRELLKKGSDHKVIVVPVVMSYHFVLEAKHLIYQYLKKTGKEKFLLPDKKDESKKIKRIVRFIWEFFSDTSEIIVSIGRPMDALGNFVDENAVSYDRFGKEVDIRDYFEKEGIITTDKQRESVYTRQLADRIVRRFHKENIVLSSHLTAFAVYNILKRKHPNLDEFALLRLPTEDINFPIDMVADVVSQLQDRLEEMAANKDIILSEKVKQQPLEVIYDGVVKVGKFHLLKPLAVNNKGNIYSRDFALLFYYHNRLSGYDLDNYVDWKGIFKRRPDIYDLS
ncbi:MAG TPA: glycerol acyltransferase [Saprospiraceae bacterium]|nr:glycerol acyltransferase [Saprospiraceae bacterium]